MQQPDISSWVHYCGRLHCSEHVLHGGHNYTFISKTPKMACMLFYAISIIYCVKIYFSAGSSPVKTLPLVWSMFEADFQGEKLIVQFLIYLFIYLWMID